MPPQITCFCTTWQNEETRKLHFHSNALLIRQLVEFKQWTTIVWIQPAAWFLQVFDSRLILTLLHESLNLVIIIIIINQFVTRQMPVSQILRRNVFISGLLESMVDERSRECCRSWTVLHSQCTGVLSSGFPISKSTGNAEALDRWGGKTKHHLTSLYVKIIASQRRLFLRQSVVLWNDHLC